MSKLEDAVELLKIRVPLVLEQIKGSRASWLPTVSGDLGTVQKDAEALLTEIKNARANADLAEPGKVKAVKAATKAALMKLDAFTKNVVDAIDRRCTTLEKDLLRRAAPTRPTDPSERVAYEQRLREIRDQLRPLDSLERLAVYFGTEDPVVLDAVESAPPAIEKLDGQMPKFVPFVPGAAVTERVIQRARTFAPELAREAEDVRGLVETYKSVVTGLRAAIETEIPPEVPAVAPVPEIIMMEEAKK